MLYVNVECLRMLAITRSPSFQLAMLGICYLLCLQDYHEVIFVVYQLHCFLSVLKIVCLQLCSATVLNHVCGIYLA